MDQVSKHWSEFRRYTADSRDTRALCRTLPSTERCFHPKHNIAHRYILFVQAESEAILEIHFT